MRVSDDELRQFFEAVGADPECPFCHQAFWGHPATGPKDHPPDTPREVITACVTLLGEERETVGTASFIPFMCGNCGYTRLQHARFLQNWLEAQRENSDEE